NSILGFQGNRDLALNMINWLSSDEDLISIRPKDPADNRITLSRAQMQGLFYTSVILMPLAIVLAGVSVWWRRR
ncbi:MAG: ABC transporter, partial [Bryobacteraceae bacterium]|nr:ABC transporter [Bryobacteraceae bacterium]